MNGTCDGSPFGGSLPTELLDPSLLASCDVVTRRLDWFSTAETCPSSADGMTADISIGSSGAASGIGGEELTTGLDDRETLAIPALEIANLEGCLMLTGSWSAHMGAADFISRRRFGLGARTGLVRSVREHGMI